MNAKFATLFLLAAVVSSPVMAQTASTVQAKPSLLSRVKAVGHKSTATKTAATPAAKPATSAGNNGQGQRTAKSLACSKQADAKNIHGKDRKSFMSHCKKA